MHFKTFFIFSVLFAAPSALANNADSSSTGTKVSCFTQMGPKPAKIIPTSRSTSTQFLSPATITKTVRSTFKVTQSPKTIVVTRYDIKITTTTLKTLTKPFTTTLTETALAISTNVDTTTSTITLEESTTLTVSSSIPTVDGFRSFQDTAGLRPVKIRGESNPLMQRQNKNGGCEGPSYPQAVQCKLILQIKVIKTATVQAQPTTVRLPAPVVLKATTATITKTAYQIIGKMTFTKPETTTTTFTAVELSTSTILTSTTTTQTATATVTSYDACQSNNMISVIDGKRISNAYNNIGGGGSSIFTNTQAASAYDCCVACQSNGAGSRTGCQGYAYIGTRCASLYSGAGICAPSQNAGFALLSAGPVGTSYTFGNGPCGYFHAQDSV